jgi:hypothetical protein
LLSHLSVFAFSVESSAVNSTSALAFKSDSIGFGLSLDSISFGIFVSGQNEKFFCLRYPATNHQIFPPTFNLQVTLFVTKQQFFLFADRQVQGIFVVIVADLDVVISFDLNRFVGNFRFRFNSVLKDVEKRFKTLII